MDKKSQGIICGSVTVLLLLVSTGMANATTVYYQPTPYPKYKYDGSAMPQNIEIVHLWDGWINDHFYGLIMQKDGILQFGGWGDIYRTYMRVDVAGLPSNPTSATLWLVAFPGGGTATSDVWFQQITSPWDNLWNQSVGWVNQPTVTSIGTRAGPAFNQWVWWGTYLTSTYNAWKSSPSTNYGMRLDPLSTNNTFSKFESSRNTVSDGYRPIWQIDFTSPVTVPSFKLPLPGSNSWLVTTEPGGYDCIDKLNGQYWPDTAHQGSNYFSVDFSWRNTNGAYGDPDSSASINIPIKAAAAGTVTWAGYNSSLPGNGYYVEITHESTGFTTRYLHMRSNLQVAQGNTVAQGQTLGYMWHSGLGSGSHLHFGVRYNGDGSAESNGKYVTMEGLLLKSYQSECFVNGSGWATDYKRYYQSTNSI